jgi:hypothetical protein
MESRINHALTDMYLYALVLDAEYRRRDPSARGEIGDALEALRATAEALRELADGGPYTKPLRTARTAA